MKKLKFFVLLLLFSVQLSFLMADCSQGNRELASGRDELNRLQHFLERVAKGLMRLSRQPAFRKVLYDQVEKKFDGEYNVLLKDLYLKSKEIGIDMVFEMEESLIVNGDTPEVAARELKSAFKGYRLKDGRVLYPQIYIPAFNNKRIKELLRYDDVIVVVDDVVSKRNKFWGLKSDENCRAYLTSFQIDERYAFENEVWVVAVNERVDIQGRVKKEVKKYLSSINLSKPAVEGNNLFLEKIYCSNLSAIESWTKGGPELEVKIFQKDKGNFYQGFYYPSRSEIDRIWYLLNQYIGYWRYQEDGDRLMCYWEEKDYSPLKDITISLSWQPFKNNNGPVVTVSFKVGPEDDICGYQIIDKENFPAFYSTGIIEWRMHY